MLSFRRLGCARDAITGLHRQSAIRFFHRQERNGLGMNQSASRDGQGQRGGRNVVRALAQNVDVGISEREDDSNQ